VLLTVYWGPGPQRVHASSSQSTAHSPSTVKCNPIVTVRKSSPWRWPSRVETCRSVLRLMIKLSLCICWWLLFLLLPINCTRTWIYYVWKHKILTAIVYNFKLILTLPSRVLATLYSVVVMRLHFANYYWQSSVPKLYMSFNIYLYPMRMAIKNSRNI
jgi:presenilin-like A22 family membrane protease